mmetsp:Transcript_86741/g.137630  ORF Transcript_86741/g.137630 Transcript_86741/m.137630 type:complete len:423 (-) Transcript_86741:102-1370(-)
MGYALRNLILAIGLHLVRCEGTCSGCEDGSVLLQNGPVGKAMFQAEHEEGSLVAAVFDEDPDETLEGYTFEAYMKEYGKKYSGQELEQRKTIFEASYKMVKEHNAGRSTFEMGINEYSDWTPEELKSLRGLRKNRRKTGASSSKEFRVESASKIPIAFDWRDQDDVVSPVKNQGHCGSCWAFAATATVESAVAIAEGSLTVLAPQPMVSCAQNPRHCGGTGGCDGATAQIGFEYVMNHSLTYEEVVGYKSFWGKSQECSLKMQTHVAAYPVASISGFVTNPTNDYLALMEALVTHGPQAVSVDASGWSPYQSGIANFCDVAENIDIDHAVVLVGYGNGGSIGYWTVRNSWGTMWGEEGYIRLIRHEEEDSYCGWDNTPSHGSLCADENVTQQYVCGTCGILFDTSHVVGANYVGMGSGDINR